MVVAREPQPVGLAFEVSDLMLAQSWADSHALRMVVELDSCCDDGEYEEVLAFYPANSVFHRWTVWRSALDSQMVVVPASGATRRFPTLAAALGQMIRTAGLKEAAGKSPRPKRIRKQAKRSAQRD